MKRVYKIAIVIVVFGSLIIFSLLQSLSCISAFLLGAFLIILGHMFSSFLAKDMQKSKIIISIIIKNIIFAIFIFLVALLTDYDINTLICMAGGFSIIQISLLVDIVVLKKVDFNV